MKRKGIALFLALTLLVFSIFVLAAPEGTPPGADRIFKFNIIGVPNEKSDFQMEDNGSRIFVKLDGTSAISLIEGEEFEILDANGTSGLTKKTIKDFADLDIVLDDYGLVEDDQYYGALLSLKNPFEADGFEPYVLDGEEREILSDYSIYIRSLGKPDGWASITTCAELVDDGAELYSMLPNAVKKEIQNRKGIINPDAYASIEQVGQEITERPRGKSVFTNVTAELTTIVFEIKIEVTEGVFETYYIRVPIFDDMLKGEYWEYDNHGLKLLQVWIYDDRTNVAAGDDAILNPPVE